ncbi:hypothetical protein BH10BDE1_BH10BDE1_09170 [soil metagenome]
MIYLGIPKDVMPKDTTSMCARTKEMMADLRLHPRRCSQTLPGIVTVAVK